MVYADQVMRTVSLDRAAEDLAALISQVTDFSEPVQILGTEGDAVLISAADWRSIQETLYLSSIPGMVDSIVEARKAGPDEFVEDLDWDDES